MICLVMKIKNPLNYDVIFPDDIVGEGPTKGEEARVRRVDPVTFEYGEEESHHTYRIKLDKSKIVSVDGIGKVIYHIVKWNDANGGVFVCDSHYTDTYGRIVCDLLDPITRVSVAAWLSTNYPENVCTHR